MATQLMEVHGTAKIPGDGVISRSMQIFKTPAEVNRAWESAEIPGRSEIKAATGNRGTVVTVELDEKDPDSYEQALSPFQGNSTSQQLESALRQFKARLETGEVATTDGQPSGRRE